MSELLDSIIALEGTVLRCIPRLAEDPVLVKCEFNVAAVLLHAVEYHERTGQQVVVLEPCGPLSDYIAATLHEMLVEEHVDAKVAYHY